MTEPAVAEPELHSPPSLWGQVTAPGPALPSLEAAIDVDVVVIGAGFTGLSAALHLARSGVSVAVLEAVEPGHGASGRNNGQVIPTLTHHDPDAIEARFKVTGERFVGLIRDSADALFALARELEVPEAEQTGWVQPAHSPGRVRLSQARAEQWARRGAPVALLSREETVAMTGSEAWHGGFWNRSGGHINPLALVRGLVRGALAAGVRLYARSPVIAFSEQAGLWRAATERGSVRARGLVLATHAYTDAVVPHLAPEISTALIPVTSWQMATEPLSDACRTRILPGRQALSDTHGDLHFLRWEARGRLVTGGALALPHRGAERLRARIGARFERLYPGLGPWRFDVVWNGRIAATQDRMPRIVRLGPDAYAFAGCNGRAVALSLAVGRELARALTGTVPRDLALPLAAAMRSIPFHGVARHLAPLMLLLYRARDAREIS